MTDGGGGVTGLLVEEDEGFIDPAVTVPLAQSFPNTATGVQVMV